MRKEQVPVEGQAHYVAVKVIQEAGYEVADSAGLAIGEEIPDFTRMLVLVPLPTPRFKLVGLLQSLVWKVIHRPRRQVLGIIDLSNVYEDSLWTFSPCGLAATMPMEQLIQKIEVKLPSFRAKPEGIAPQRHETFLKDFH